MEPKTVATNKKAYRDYHILDKWECGIALSGGEVKSIRNGEVNFKDSFARIENGEVFLYNLHITPYREASYMNDDPDRVRKLLLHKREINKIASRIVQKGLSLIPTRIYFNKRGFVKIELALGRGKKLYDKREDIKKKAIERGLQRVVKSRRR